MEIIRRPFQGVLNIIRFNWHFYLLSVIFLLLLIMSMGYVNKPFRFIAEIVVIVSLATLMISLLVSFYVYDLSDLYNLSWLDRNEYNKSLKIVNINAGFDETSELLRNKFKNSELIAFDFYDPLKHTEISITRARKAYPSYPNTVKITTNSLPLANNSIDKAFAFLSAHEIRSGEERNLFFKELARIIKPAGQIIVTEHLRDLANLFAYNIGVFHFHSKQTWYKAFSSSGLKLRKEVKTTPFITTFILEKDGIQS